MSKRRRWLGSRRSLLIMLYVHLGMLLVTLPVSYLLMDAARVLGSTLTRQAIWTALGGIWLAALAVDSVLYVICVLRPIIELEKAISALEADESLHAAEGGAPPQNESGKHKSIPEIFQSLMHKQATVEILKREAEINALQNQINPHFLYNTLETIRGQAVFAGAHEVASTTKALADIFRYNISKKGTMIYLDEELANIDSYMQIQQIRFSNKFELRKEIDEDVRNIKIPKLVIQPVVENALKYGLEVKRERGHVLIRAFRTQAELVIIVKDDGVGMEPEALRNLNRSLSEEQSYKLAESRGASIGLININNRIKLIYGDAYGISIMSAKNAGTMVTLRMGVLH